MIREVLGIDIGGVIISHSSTNGVYLPLPGVFEVIRELREKRFGNRIFIVSHADMDLRRKMIRWLGEQQFYKKTGTTISRIFFCDRKSEKADIAEEKNMTHFIDDRKEIMVYLNRIGIKNLFLFQGREEEEGLYDFVLPHVIRVQSWLEVKKTFFD